MKKFFRRLLITLGTTLLLAIGLAVATAAVFNRQIGERIVSAINQHLTTELRVNQINLLFFQNFPDATAVLKAVVLEDNRDSMLLEAATISFNLNLWGLMQGDFQIDAATISEGRMMVWVDEEGQPNYPVWDRSVSADSVARLELNNASWQKVQMQDMELVYVNEQTRQHYAVNLDRAEFRGAFEQQQFSLFSDAELTTQFLEVGSLRYLSATPLSFKGNLLFALPQSSCQMEDLEVRLGNTIFNVGGAIVQRDSSTNFALLVNSEEGSLKDIFRLLPDSYASYLDDLASQGDFRFAAQVEGVQNANEYPVVSAQLEVKDHKLTTPHLVQAIEHVAFRADYTSGQGQDSSTSQLIIQDFTAYLDQQAIQMKLHLDDFTRPQIDFRLDGTLPLGAVYGLLHRPAVSEGSGQLIIDDVQLRGALSDLVRPNRTAAVHSSGRLEFDRASLTLNNEKLSINQGEVEIQDNQLLLKNLQFAGANSEFTLNGQAFNLWPVLFDAQQAELEFTGVLNSQQLDIDRLLTAVNLQTARDTAHPTGDSLRIVQIQRRKRLTQLLKGSCQATVRQYTYGTIAGSDFTGIISFDNQVMRLRGGTNAMQGQIQLDGQMVFAQAPRLSAQFDLEGVDITTLFNETNHFNQQVLTGEQINGSLNSQLLIEASWSEKGEFLDDQLHVMAAVDITNGAFKDWALFNALGSFVKVNELKDLSFQSLQSYFEIRRQQIYIPALFVQGEHLNLSLRGQYSFSNELDYLIKVNADQALVERFKKYDPGLEPIKARADGFFNLYYNMYGDLTAYTFEKASRRGQSAINRSQVRQKEIQLSLNEVFSDVPLFKEPGDWLDIAAQ